MWRNLLERSGHYQSQIASCSLCIKLAHVHYYCGPGEWEGGTPMLEQKLRLTHIQCLSSRLVPLEFLLL
jgi:hypothetical protein